MSPKGIDLCAFTKIKFDLLTTKVFLDVGSDFTSGSLILNFMDSISFAQAVQISELSRNKFSSVFTQHKSVRRLVKLIVTDVSLGMKDFGTRTDECVIFQKVEKTDIHHLKAKNNAKLVLCGDIYTPLSGNRHLTRPRLHFQTFLRQT